MVQLLSTIMAHASIAQVWLMVMLSTSAISTSTILVWRCSWFMRRVIMVMTCMMLRQEKSFCAKRQQKIRGVA